MTKILVVDDNLKIRRLMEIYLKREGFDVLTAENGQQALLLLDLHQPSLIIADIMMPELDGYELTQALREAGFDIPILMVTARDTYPDKKRGFEIGADDYMTKPVDMDEVVLRVKALLRRARISSEKKLIIGELELHSDTLEVKTRTQSYMLTRKEFLLLFKLLSYPKKIFTRQELLDDIWGLDSDVDERTVDVHIKRLREKLSERTEFEIVTVRGLGYKGEKLL